MKKSACDFFREQRTPIPPLTRADLIGQTVVVTGANTGLGFEACLHFAKMGPGKLVLACRNEAKGREAMKSQLIFSKRMRINR